MKKPAGVEKELMDWANDPLSSVNHAGTKFERMNARHGWTVDDWAWFAKRFVQS